jgi:hypothetical protein
MEGVEFFTTRLFKARAGDALIPSPTTNQKGNNVGAGLYS